MAVRCSRCRGRGALPNGLCRMCTHADYIKEHRKKVEHKRIPWQTVKGLVEYHDMDEERLRQWLGKRAKNGLGACVKTEGKTLMVHVPTLQEWMKGRVMKPRKRNVNY